MDNKRTKQLKAFDRLLTIMDELRTNCPWDKKQTFASLRHLTIEETYELSEALLSGDLEEVKNEMVFATSPMSKALCSLPIFA